MHNNYSQM